MSPILVDALNKRMAHRYASFGETRELCTSVFKDERNNNLTVQRLQAAQNHFWNDDKVRSNVMITTFPDFPQQNSS